MDGLMTRRRAEELDAALSGARVPGQRPELEGDLAVVARLRDAGAALGPAPSDEFRTALRTRLLAVAAVQGIGETAAAPVAASTAVSWRSRAATVAAGVGASVVAVTGVAVASSQSVPGDAFYGVKRTTESLQLRLADGAREQGERHLQFAAERLDEARELAAGGSLSDDDERRVLEVLADMDADVRAASQLLVEDFRASRDAEGLQLLSRFAAEQRTGLAALLPVLDGAGDDAVRESLDLVGQVGTQADELLMLVDCTTACDPTASAPVLPLPGVPLGSDQSAVPCECPAPPPAPSVAPVPPAAPAPAPSTGSAPDPGATGGPAPAPPSSAPPAPAPSPSPSSPGGPLPGVPLPSVPGVPLPTLPSLEDPLAPVAPLVDPLAPVPVPPLTGSGGLLDGVTGALSQVGPALVVGGPASVVVSWLHSLL